MATVCGSASAEGSDTKALVTEVARRAKAALGGADARVGLLFASPAHPLADALAVAQRILPGAEWLGCSTAGELSHEGPTRGGVSVMLISWGAAAHRLAPVHPLDGELHSLALDLCSEFPSLMDRARKESWEHAITLVLGDGLSPALESIVTEIRRVTRLEHTLVGGGAGDDGALERSWTGTPGGTLLGGVAAMHVASEHAWGVGIGQGPRARTPRMTVTRAEANVVYEIDGRPALDAYHAYAAELGVALDEASLPSFLIANEIGIYLFDDIVRVRAGFASSPDGSIRFAGEVPEGSVVAIVSAEPGDLLAAARAAATDARDAVDGAVAGVLLFSCITRSLVLGDRLAEEVAAVADVFGDGVPIAGFSSYGEIARVAGRLDGYHNHTLVVAAIPE